MDNWLPTLLTATPTEGFDLAIRLSRRAIRSTQPDHAPDATALIAVSQVVAVNVATIAAANDHWRGSR